MLALIKTIVTDSDEVLPIPIKGRINKTWILPGAGLICMHDVACSPLPSRSSTEVLIPRSLRCTMYFNCEDRQLLIPVCITACCFIIIGVRSFSLRDRPQKLVRSRKLDGQDICAQSCGTKSGFSGYIDPLGFFFSVESDWIQATSSHVGYTGQPV
jgi:hypothetical protein